MTPEERQELIKEINENTTTIITEYLKAINEKIITENKGEEKENESERTFY